MTRRAAGWQRACTPMRRRRLPSCITSARRQATRLAHEIGHIIGARHDLNMDTTMSPFPYGHGFVNGTKWRDIMSYKESCGGCPRLPVWSSPKLMVKGEPAGTPEQDNARVIPRRRQGSLHSGNRRPASNGWRCPTQPKELRLSSAASLNELIHGRSTFRCQVP